jgi:CRP-like cAMP-binding protein
MLLSSLPVQPAIKRYIKGTMIYNQGDSARYFYQVKCGEVRIANINEEGKEFIQGVFGEGACFGEPALICNKPYPAAAFANKDTELFALPKEAFFKLVEQEFPFHWGITKILSERLFYKAMMLQEVANEEGEHRLQTLLEYLSSHSNSSTLSITKQQLADMTGLRVETVIRLMKKIEEKGMITSKRGKIEVLTIK